MNVKLLTEHNLEFLSLKGGCRGSSESTLLKLPHCWKSRVTAQLLCPNPNSGRHNKGKIARLLMQGKTAVATHFEPIHSMCKGSEMYKKTKPVQFCIDFESN